MKNQRGFTLTELVGVILGIAFIVAFCGLVYIAIHFLAKIW